MNIYNSASPKYAFIYTKQLDICIFINYIKGRQKSVSLRIPAGCFIGNVRNHLHEAEYCKGAKS